MERSFARNMEKEAHLLRPQPQEHDSTEQEIQLTEAERVGHTVPGAVARHYDTLAKSADHSRAVEASLLAQMQRDRTRDNRIDAELIAVKERIVQELMAKDAFIQSATPRMEAFADVAALTLREAQQQGKAKEKKEHNLLKEKYVARVKALRNEAKKDPRYIEEKKRLEKLRQDFEEFNAPTIELDQEEEKPASQDEAAHAA